MHHDEYPEEGLGQSSGGGLPAVFLDLKNGALNYAQKDSNGGYTTIPYKKCVGRFVGIKIEYDEGNPEKGVEPHEVLVIRIQGRFDSQLRMFIVKAHWPSNAARMFAQHLHCLKAGSEARLETWSATNNAKVTNCLVKRWNESRYERQEWPAELRQAVAEARDELEAAKQAKDVQRQNAAKRRFDDAAVALDGWIRQNVIEPHKCYGKMSLDEEASSPADEMSDDEYDAHADGDEPVQTSARELLNQASVQAQAPVGSSEPQYAAFGYTPARVPPLEQFNEAATERQKGYLNDLGATMAFDPERVSAAVLHCYKVDKALRGTRAATALVIDFVQAATPEQLARAASFDVPIPGLDEYDPFADE